MFLRDIANILYNNIEGVTQLSLNWAEEKLGISREGIKKIPPLALLAVNLRGHIAFVRMGALTDLSLSLDYPVYSFFVV